MNQYTRSARSFLAIICLAISVPLSAFAALPESDETNSIITEMLEVTGITRAVNSIPEQFQEVLSQDPKMQSLRPEQRAAIQAAFARAYSSPAMTAVISQTFLRNFDETRFKQFIALHHQPLVRKFLALEEAAETAEGRAGMQAYMALLSNHPATPERMALAQRLDNVTRASAAITDIQIAVIRAITVSVALLQPAELRPSDEQLKAFLDQLEGQLRASLTPLMVMSARQYHLYAYRDVSDAELKQYVDGYDNPAIQWCIFLLEQGLQAALTEASANVIHQINETKKSGGSI